MKERKKTCVLLKRGAAPPASPAPFPSLSLSTRAHLTADSAARDWAFFHRAAARCLVEAEDGGGSAGGAPMPACAILPGGEGVTEGGGRHQVLFRGWGTGRDT